METIYTLLFILQVLVAVTLIGLILIQHGKGADAGAAFGSGSSSTVFGSQGSGSFLTKVTSILAFIFLSNSLFLGYLASEGMQQTPSSLLDQAALVIEQQIPEQETPLQEEDVPAIIETQSEPSKSDIPNTDIPNTDKPNNL